MKTFATYKQKINNSEVIWMVMYYFYITEVWYSFKSTLSASINAFCPVCVSKDQLSVILIFIFKYCCHNLSCFTKFKEMYNKFLATAAKNSQIIHLCLTLSNERWSLESFVSVMHWGLNKRGERNTDLAPPQTCYSTQYKHAARSIVILKWLTQSFTLC